MVLFSRSPNISVGLYHHVGIDFSHLIHHLQHDEITILILLLGITNWVCDRSWGNGMMDLKSIGLSLRILLIMNIFSNLSYIFLSYQPWDFFGRNDAKAETPVLWPCHAKSWLIGKDSDAWRDWGQEEKGTTEDEMAGWHHWLDGLESGWTLGVGDGQGGLACCDSWGRKELDTTEWLNWTEPNS